MQAYIAEFVGTAILVLLGDGVCCNVNLEKSGFKGGGAVYILIGWGMAVMVPAFTFGAMSGSHFNPAVTIGAACGATTAIGATTGCGTNAACGFGVTAAGVWVFVLDSGCFGSVRISIASASVIFSPL